MFGPIRAVAVDDKPTHLLSITTGLTAVGIPCMPYLYDRDKSRLVPKPVKHEFLRLVFMDMNLAELGATFDAKNLAGVIMKVLGELISADSGPYLLVFWTQVVGRVEEVKPLVYERLEGIPTPLDIVELSKLDFLGTAKEGASDLEHALKPLFVGRKLAALGKKLRELTVSRPELNVVSNWESRATEAAGRAVNEVTRRARDDVADKTQVGQSLTKVLSAIAREAAGKTEAANNPARALDSGMTGILEDQFSVSVDERTYSKTVREALLPTIKTKPKFANSARLAAGLNSFFHVDVSVSSAKTTSRGAVFAGKKHFTEKLLGIPHANFVEREFLAQTQPANRVAELKNLAELVLVEVGADCDHAQAKSRTLRYLVGYEVPETHFDLLVRAGDLKGRLANEALVSFGPWQMSDDHVVYLVVSCRRFFTWQRAKAPQGKVKYRLRSALVNKLLHHYSHWSSRPGIFEFRG